MNTKNKEGNSRCLTIVNWWCFITTTPKPQHKSPLPSHVSPDPSLRQHWRIALHYNSVVTKKVTDGWFKGIEGMEGSREEELLQSSLEWLASLPNHTTERRNTKSHFTTAIDSDDDPTTSTSTSPSLPQLDLELSPDPSLRQHWRIALHYNIVVTKRVTDGWFKGIKGMEGSREEDNAAANRNAIHRCDS